MLVDCQNFPDKCNVILWITGVLIVLKCEMFACTQSAVLFMCWVDTWRLHMICYSFVFMGPSDSWSFRACFFMGWAVVLVSGSLGEGDGRAMDLLSSHKIKVIVNMEHQDKVRTLYNPTILTLPKSCFAYFDWLWCFCRKETVKPWTAAIYHCKSCVDMIITDKVSSQIAITRH